MATTTSSIPADAKQLAPPRLKQADYARSAYRIQPDAGAELADVLEPEYLTHVAERLRPGDRLEIMPECMSWYAEALVVDATRLSARIQTTLGPIAIDAGERVLASDVFESRWISPAVRFGVARKSDGAFMVKNLETKAEADQWIANRVGMRVTVDQPAKPAKARKREGARL